MSDAIRICSRCGTPVNDNAFALALEKEVPESVPQELRLCARCVESFKRWYLKCGKSTARRATGVHSEGCSASPSSFVLNRSKRRHRRKKQMHRVLVVTSLTILVFLVVFYWTWTILKTATRIDE